MKRLSINILILLLSFSAVSQNDSLETKKKLDSCFGDFVFNSCGLNDNFHIAYTGNLKYTLSIYNRWGNNVFYTTDKKETWIGENRPEKSIQKIKQFCPGGTYYYTVKIGNSSCNGYVTYKN